MKESDWKQFKTVKEAALNTCCEDALNGYQQAISDSSKTHHQRFLKVYDLVHETNAELAQIFDGHSRSQAVIQMLLMRKHGLVPDTAISTFSNEFRQHTDPELVSI